MNKQLIVGLICLGAIGIVAYFIFQKQMSIKLQPPSSAPLQDPSQSQGTGRDCEQILVAGGAAAASTGNPYAVAGGAFAGVFNKQLCNGWRKPESSAWSFFNPIGGGMTTINKWQNGDKSGAVVDVLNPVTQFKGVYNSLKGLF